MVGKDLAPKYQDANNLCQTILPSPEQSTCTKVEREVRNSDVTGASVLLATSEKTDCMQTALIPIQFQTVRLYHGVTKKV